MTKPVLPEIVFHPTEVSPPSYFEGPRHKQVVLALAQEALHRYEHHSLIAEAETDYLTQLENRRSFDKVVSFRINDQKNKQFDPFALMAIDLDNFKTVNDTKGHAEGDRALRDTADVLTRILNVRDGERAFRIGGDEFVLMVNMRTKNDEGRDTKKSPEEVLEGLTNRIKEEVSYIAKIIGVPQFGASVGYAIYSKGDTLEKMMAEADSSMYADKEAMKVELHQRQ